MMRFAINGFGRVGRTLLRVYHTRPDARAKLELSAINEIADADTVVHLARYDSNYGRYPGRIARSDHLLAIDQYLVPLSHEAEVSALPWGSLGIDMVFECTGAFTDRATAEQHLHAGADRVLFSHPAESDVDAKQTQVAAGKLAKILIWFDNEWAYASRMIDVALAWEQQINQSLPTTGEQMR